MLLGWTGGVGGVGGAGGGVVSPSRFVSREGGGCRGPDRLRFLDGVVGGG